MRKLFYDSKPRALGQVSGRAACGKTAILYDLNGPSWPGVEKRIHQVSAAAGRSTSEAGRKSSSGSEESSDEHAGGAFANANAGRSCWASSAAPPWRPAEELAKLKPAPRKERLVIPTRLTW